jgi:hypothetical protein
MTKTQQVKYKKVAPTYGGTAAWEVRVDDSPVLAGTVEKVEAGTGTYWQGHYVGSPIEGYEVKPASAWKRINAAWNLINS